MLLTFKKTDTLTLYNGDKIYSILALLYNQMINGFFSKRRPFTYFEVKGKGENLY